MHGGVPLKVVLTYQVVQVVCLCGDWGRRVASRLWRILVLVAVVIGILFYVITREAEAEGHGEAVRVVLLGKGGGIFLGLSIESYVVIGSWRMLGMVETVIMYFYFGTDNVNIWILMMSFKQSNFLITIMNEMYSMNSSPLQAFTFRVQMFIHCKNMFTETTSIHVKSSGCTAHSLVRRASRYHFPPFSRSDTEVIQKG